MLTFASRFVVNGVFMILGMLFISATLHAQSPSLTPQTVEDLSGGKRALQAERDLIGILLAYATVANSWQDNDIKEQGKQRGHNIGAVLVSDQGKVLSVKQNAAYVTGDRTQHAEVRAIQSYLSFTESRYVENCTIYTTLEPCPMCSGMMLMTKLKRVVYGQPDPEYGDALAKLAGYPRGTVAVASKDVVTQALIKAFDAYNGDPAHGSVVDFLYSSEAKAVFDDAKEDLLSFQVEFPQNNAFCEAAKELVR